jgi:hypothetical protein
MIETIGNRLKGGYDVADADHTNFFLCKFRPNHLLNNCGLRRFQFLCQKRLSTHQGLPCQVPEQTALIIILQKSGRYPEICEFYRTHSTFYLFQNSYLNKFQPEAPSPDLLPFPTNIVVFINISHR